jgi:hypothetical protein
LNLIAHHSDSVTAAYLSWLNLQHAARRISLGKQGVIIDSSLEKYRGSEADAKIAANDQAFDDLTDLQNEDFLFVL